MKAEVIGYIRKQPDYIYIEVLDRYWEGTLKMDKFSHIILLWWISGRDDPISRKHLQGYPPVEGAELSGVFATRSPSRPTPIGLTVAKIDRINETEHRIYIDQIDAIDGTPVVDIKPYMPFSDKVDKAIVPEWFRNNRSRYSDTPLG